MNSFVSPGLIDLTREPNFSLGVIEIRPATREVIASGERDVLEPRVMQVLVALSRRRDEVISRDELIVSCWAGRTVGDDAINRCIGRIRRLSETRGGFRLETIPRVGYRLTEMSSPSSQDEGAAHSEKPAQNIGGDTRRAAWFSWLALHARAMSLVALVLIVVMGGAAYWLLHRHAAEERAPAKFTIAVLPFTPPLGDREAEQLGDAVSASIADALVREGLDVVSPAKTRQYRGASKADAAQALHADFVIDGEIRREGGKIKVPVRTVEAASGTTLVVDTVEVPAADAASLPELAAASALGCGWGLLSALDTSAKWDLRVIAGSLRVIKHFARRSEAVYAYDIATQLAASVPGDAYAHYLHAMTAANFAPIRPVDQRLPVVLEARAAAQKALQLDPRFGEVYAALNRVTPSFNWTVRESYLMQGLRLRPTSPLTYMDLLALRMSAGYLRLGARMAEDSFSNHPPFDNTTFEAINGRLWLGDPAAARPLIVRAMKFYPGRIEFPAKMFEATAFFGALDDAEALLEDPAAAPLLRPPGEGGTYRTVVAALRHGRAADVNAVVGNCLNVQGRAQEFRRICFVALVRLDRLDDAFRMAELLYPDQRGASQAEIERKWLAQTPFNTAYLVIPATAPLRADPRYRAVVERVGLLQFWKERGQAPDFCAAEKVPVCRELKL